MMLVIVLSQVGGSTIREVHDFSRAVKSLKKGPTTAPTIPAQAELGRGTLGLAGQSKFLTGLSDRLGMTKKRRAHTARLKSCPSRFPVASHRLARLPPV